MVADVRKTRLVHALLAIPERGFRVLRVIYNETVCPKLIYKARIPEYSAVHEIESGRPDDVLTKRRALLVKAWRVY